MYNELIVMLSAFVLIIIGSALYVLGNYIKSKYKIDTPIEEIGEEIIKNSTEKVSEEYSKIENKVFKNGIDEVIIPNKELKIKKTVIQNEVKRGRGRPRKEVKND